MGGWNEPQLYQNVIVMRHGPRLDNFDKNWTMATEHPWNPPLYDGDEFKNLYSKTAKKIREEVGAPIHRVIVSPFLRCLQTASRTIQALSSHDSHQQVLLSSSSNAAAAAHIRPSEIRVSFSALLYESVHRIIVFRFLQFLNIASRTIKALFFHDSHQIKASVEYGLAEMMNKKVIWVPPKDGDFKFLIPECEAQLPPEILRHNTIEKVYEKLPEWEETKEVAWNRYNDIVRTLADKYPRENLLLVTHDQAGEEMGGWNEPQLYQNVIVMRHGPRLDNFDKNWTMATEHPWNPPLYDGDEFKNLYSKTAKKIREEVGAPIHRVIVSPFLRCLQTASRTIQALSSHDSHQQVLLSSSSNAAAAAHIRPSEIRVSFSALLYESVHRIIVFRFLQFLNIASRTIKALFFHDSHQIKASVEYGLAEMMNKKVIWVPPKDGDFKFLIPECEAQLPPEILRHNTIEKVYEKLPEWEETKEVAWNRYNDIVRTLADKYPRENLLLVTHAEGVVALSSTFMNGTRVRVDYCGYVHLRRPITNGVSSFSRRSTINLMLQGQSGITLREK